MKKSETLKNKLMFVSIMLLIVLMISVLIRFFTRQIIIVRLGIENSVTDMIFCDNASMATADDLASTTYGVTDDYSIDWSKKYPFDNSETIDVDKETKESIIDRYKSAVSTFTSRIETYTQNNLVGYKTITELGRKYERVVGWNFSSFNEYNGTYQMSDGYWTSLKERNDVTEHISSTKDFAAFCDEECIDFLYVQAPYKVSKYTDSDISGVVDFSNQNADDFLAGLKSAGIETLDLRENINAQSLLHHELFYRTDHHWKAETGLWATKEIAIELNKNFSNSIDTTLYDIGKYDSVVYKDWFLGSYGKKVTLTQTKPDDISLLYPKFNSSLCMSIPSINIDKTGDFSIIYNMEQIEKRDYYNLNPYAAYGYGDRAITEFKNKKSADGKETLIIHDSFADTVVPFFALGTENVKSVDLRYFNGSLKKYIAKTKPDVVIVIYNAGDFVDDVEYKTHTSTFDFN